MKKVISVVGARPNFMKVAPLHKEFSKYKDQVKHLICHTGQHYDEKMSKVFFEELELPIPDFYLGIGSGSHAVQTAGVMIQFEQVLLKEQPDLVIVVGDVNSTIACSMVAKKMQIKVAHVEAGLRSFDMSMPEEINRVLTDSISDFLFVTEKSGIENLAAEGVIPSKVYFVGNVMIDSLISNLDKINASAALNQYGLESNRYILATFHRPSNVDQKDSLEKILNLLNKLAAERKVIFPVHPRTKNNIHQLNLSNYISKNLILCDPLGYIDFLALVKDAELILTDSGGIQEESTFLKVQCVTLRKNTERPITVERGTNHLAGTNINHVEQTVTHILNGYSKKGVIPELWDGYAAQRICEILLQNISEA